MLSERRTGPYRDKCKIQALVEADSFAERKGCIVEDLTEAGAKLKFRHAVALPTHFKLLIPVLDDVWDERTVELRWRAGAAAGVRFISDTASDEDQAASEIEVEKVS